jgi:hypothetical protein
MRERAVLDPLPQRFLEKADHVGIQLPRMSLWGQWWTSSRFSHGALGAAEYLDLDGPCRGRRPQASQLFYLRGRDAGLYSLINSIQHEELTHINYAQERIENDAQPLRKNGIREAYSPAQSFQPLKASRYQPLPISRCELRQAVNERYCDQSLPFRFDHRPPSQEQCMAKSICLGLPFRKHLVMARLCRGVFRKIH